MPWKTSVTVSDLQSAMNQCDSMGLRTFIKHHGFKPAKGIRITYQSRKNTYVARPLIAAAYSIQHPHSPPLTPKNFKDNDAHIFLEKCGFTLNHF